MAEEDEDYQELSNEQKKEIAKWFLLNSPAGEIKYVAKGLSLSSCILCVYVCTHRRFCINVSMFVCARGM